MSARLDQRFSPASLLAIGAAGAILLATATSPLRSDDGAAPGRLDSGAAGRNPFRVTQPKSTAPRRSPAPPAAAAGTSQAIATDQGGAATGAKRAPATPPNAGGAAIVATDAATEASAAARFRVPKDFRVQEILKTESTGSLIALAFNENGDVLLSRENGPLLRAVDTNGDHLVDTVETYCDQVKNCQGILPLGGRVFVNGDGPQGLGFYRLSDSDKDGAIDDVKLLFSFKCKVVEHGPHGAVLGPDGLIYLAIGNHATLDKEPEATSPYSHPYEGDLPGPRYEDPNGMGAGIKAPGGTIIRTDPDGEFVEVVSGGLRNPYDLAFSASGELFTHDADMEWDVGLPWYRPTRVLHVTPGSEFGWRSGWSKWPEYYEDSLPGALDTAGGSPAGMTFYNHFMFPVNYQNSLFSCDWAKGRIVVVRFKPNGSSFRGESEVFIEGQPMNATDIAVGPDGGVYFTTGGRGTDGGLYRVSWLGKVPPQVTSLGTGIMAAIRQPQLESAWARQNILKIREDMGAEWGTQLIAAATQKNLQPMQRLRVLDLMQLFGPAPTKQQLLALATDEQPLVRGKAAYLLGIHGDETTATQLARMIHDPEPRVARQAVEALARAGQSTTLTNLAAPLSMPDRHLAFAARRALERLPADKWLPSVLASRDVKLFSGGATAMLVADPTEEMAKAVVDRARTMLKDRHTPAELLSILRVCELAALRGNLAGEQVGELRTALAGIYPQKDALVNRELARLLVHFDDTSAGDAMFAQLKSNIAPVEKLHLAMAMSRFHGKLTSAQRFELLRYYEAARPMAGGLSLGRYVERAAVELGSQLDEEEQAKVLAEAEHWPTTALAVLAKLPKTPDANSVSTLRAIDQRIANREGDAFDRLRIGVVALLARGNNDEAMTYLRLLYDTQPERRNSVAMGLAQSPDGDNWPLLVRSLSNLEGIAAQEVLTKLAKVQRVPTEPEAVRQVILRGYLLGEQGGQSAIALLEHWTGQQASAGEESIPAALDKWQAWFHKTYPNEPEAKPLPKQAGRWEMEQLIKHLRAPTTQGDPAKGALVYAKANCAKCHRHGSVGTAVGPELTTVAKRFQKREILEAILFPSNVVSDQYASKRVLTHDGQTYIGLATTDAEGNVTVKLPTLETVVVPHDDIDQVTASNVSSMPENLLDPLSLEEITDLFAYLAKPGTASVAAKPSGTPIKK